MGQKHVQNISTGYQVNRIAIHTVYIWRFAFIQSHWYATNNDKYDDTHDDFNCYNNICVEVSPLPTLQSTLSIIVVYLWYPHKVLKDAP